MSDDPFDDGENAATEARAEYLRQQARERKRRQRDRAKAGHNAGPDGHTVTPAIEDQSGGPGIDPPELTGKGKNWPEAKALKWKEFLVDRIEHGMTLTAALRKHPGGPNIATIWRWLREDATFAAAYDRAKISAADAFFYQSIDIADSAQGDAAAISAARLRVDSRRYAASKLRPEKYADRSEVHQTGEVKHVISDDQRARALAAFIARQAIAGAQSLPDVRRLIEQKTEKTEAPKEPDKTASP